MAISVDASKVQGLRTQGLHGSYSVEEGFNTLLRSSGYVIGRTAAGYVSLPVPEPVSAVNAQILPVVKVTAHAGGRGGRQTLAGAGIPVRELYRGLEPGRYRDRYHGK